MVSNVAPSYTYASRNSASPLPNSTTASRVTPMGPWRGLEFLEPEPVFETYTPMVLAFDIAWMVGGHLTVVLEHE